MSRALVVVDMQRTFVESIDGGEGVLQAVNRLVDRFVTVGETVIYTRDVRPDQRPADHPSRELATGLEIRGAVVDKGPGVDGGFSGFLLHRAGESPGHGQLSALAPRLREAGVSDLVVVGLAADVCVAATAADAVRLGYAAAIDLAASAFVHAHPDGDDAAIGDLRRAGVLVRSAA
jgi:nicotinamidase/pyrazinamidase